MKARIKGKGVEVVLYEPSLHADKFYGSRVIKDLSTFKTMCDVIVANRMHQEITDCREKVYCRDIFMRD